MVNSLWQELASSPIRVVVKHPRQDLQYFEFPAITLCPINKLDPLKVNKLINSVLGADADSGTKSSYWNSLTALSIMGYPHYQYPHLLVTQSNLSLYPIPQEDIPSIMKQILPDVADILKKCYWRGTAINCSLLFRFQRTDEGFCYSFNSKTADRNMPIDLVAPPFEVEEGHLEGLVNTVAGMFTGLELKFKTPWGQEKPKYDFQSRTPGYNIMVHNHDSLPDVSQSFQIKEGRNKIFHIMVDVSAVISEPNIQSIPFSVRKCYWQVKEEPPLEPEVDEDEDMCKINCRLTYIWQQCNCTPYFFSFDGGVRNMVSSEQAQLRLNPESTVHPDPPICDCVKPCSFINYDSDLLASDLDSPRSEDYWAYLDISYKNQYAVEYSKYVSFSYRDFTVMTGGFAGLMLGCSLISLLEVCYYSMRSLWLLLGRAWHQLTIQPAPPTPDYSSSFILPFTH